MGHEMTAYVSVQCQACGHRVPDETTPGNTDAEVGLTLTLTLTLTPDPNLALSLALTLP